MNKYLIVVFCVLTGCAVVVPYSECEAQHVNTQLLAEWYADMGDTVEENYTIQFVLRQDVSPQEISVPVLLQGHKVLLKNLPSFPVLTAEKPVRWGVVPQIGKVERSFTDIFFCSQICGKALKIRAPDFI